MSYTHSKYEVLLRKAGAPTGVANAAERQAINLGVTGVQGSWAPGFVPHIIRGAAVIPYVTTALTNPASFGFEADITTAGTPTRLFTIVAPTAGAIHKSIYYNPTYIIELKPGMVMDFRVTAAGSGHGEVILYVEPRWERPANLTGMLSTT